MLKKENTSIKSLSHSFKVNIIIINLGNCSREFFYCFKQKAKSVKTDLAFLMKSICLAYCLICILLCVIVMN